MKKIITSIIILFLACNLFAQKKEAEYKNNLFCLSLPRLFVSNFSLNYERLFKNNSSAVLVAGIIVKDNASNSKIGGNFEFQYRFYSKIRREKAFQGIYFAPYLGYRNIDIKNESDYYQVTNVDHQFFSTIGAGVVVGFKLAIVQKVVFGFELGGGIKYTTGTREGQNFNIFDYGYSGITPKGDITLGIFF